MKPLEDYEYIISAVPVFGENGVDTWDLVLPEQLCRKETIRSIAQAFADLAMIWEDEE